MQQRRRITDADVETAVRLLDAWSNKLTWDRFLAVFETEVGYRYTKMAMHKYPRVTDAFERAKHRIREQTELALRNAGSNRKGPIPHGDVALARAYEKVEEQKQRIARLEQENRDLLEQFLRWQYNANAAGVSRERLDQPLPRKHDNNVVVTYSDRKKRKPEAEE
ncbi:hypothetical protein ACFOW6_05040 [Fodinicurvata halophila]|uniref:Uncharacterized protein n=1 Tax=Fodinicurvata halophila TaxID=1419723 RepID=A0ABV8UI02_9PROT